MLLLVALFVGTSAFCQIEKPVTWSFALKKEKNDEAIVLLKAIIQNSWHIYSLDQKDGGPVKTTITFLPAADYSLIGKSSQPQPKSKFEKAFNMKVSYFENAVVFQQRIKIRKSNGALHGKIQYMTCNNQKCLPPEDLDFNINL